MIRNYIKIAWRNLFRNKVYSVINIGGLAMGITAFLLILEYVSFEKSVNQFHANLPQMYRLLNLGQKGETWGEIEPGWATLAKRNFPEIKEFCRFTAGSGQGIVKKEGRNGESFRETKISYADGNFFDFFTFRIISGDKRALNKPKVVFLSTSTALKYFGTENPLGKILTVSNEYGTTPFSVEAVYEMPPNSDINYDMVFSVTSIARAADIDNLDEQGFNTFFLLNKGADYKALDQKLTKLRDKLQQDKDGVKFRLQAFANVHLAESRADTYLTIGNLKYVYMLLIIAVLILSIAWFNYINLSTANSLKRANEVGVRKVIGATSGNLIFQFLGESLLVSALSISFALLLVTLLQPIFNTLIDRELTLSDLASSAIWMIGLGVLILGTLASGIYSAYALSNFNPVKIMKGNLSKSAKGIVLRKSLVVSQFTISVVLILATIVIYSQLRFMQNHNLGIDIDQLLVLRGPEAGQDSSYQKRQAAFWNELEQQSFVKDYSLSGTIPGRWFNFQTSGFTQPGSRAGDELKSYFFAIVGDRYLKTYGIQLKAGRNFTEQEAKVDWNANSKVLLNERAVAQFGFRSPEEAIRSKVRWDERYLEVIGVVKDYHHVGVQQAIQPTIFYPQNSNTYITVKLTPGELRDKIVKLESIYKTFFGGNPFEYFFVDENFNKQYVSENQYGRIFTTASVWAILIACMGLFGLATFTVETRTKEIGIRKVLGASVASIVGLLSVDFLKLVFVAILIACPVAWYLMAGWLKDFENRVSISWWIFAAGGLLAILIAIITIGSQSIKAALVNPVKSLKTE